MKERVIKYDARYWARSFIQDLSATIKNREELPDTKEISSGVIDRICAAARLGLFLDYDGTLQRFYNDPIDAKPDTDLLRILLSLHNKRNREIVIITASCCSSIIIA